MLKIWQCMKIASAKYKAHERTVFSHSVHLWTLSNVYFNGYNSNVLLNFVINYFFFNMCN